MISIHLLVKDTKLAQKKIKTIQKRCKVSTFRLNGTGEKIYNLKHVRITGRHAIEMNEEKDWIKEFVNKKAAVSYDNIQQYLNKFYATGYYSDVKARLRLDTLVIKLKENSQFYGIQFIGNKVYPDSVLLTCIKTKKRRCHQS